MVRVGVAYDGVGENSEEEGDGAVKNSLARGRDGCWLLSGWVGWDGGDDGCDR